LAPACAGTLKINPFRDRRPLIDASNGDSGDGDSGERLA
jgi:hypothetical protein